MCYRLIVTIFLFINLLGAVPNLTKAGAFDPIAVGARAWGMGSAFTAVTNDVYAVHWNPAGLADVRRPEMAIAHIDLQSLGLLLHDALIYAQPFVFNNTVAVSWMRMGTTGQVQFLNYSENTFILSYQQPVFSDLSTGINLKLFQVKSSKTAGGIGLDFGARYRFLPELILAVFAENLNNPEIIWQTGATDRLPINLKAGLAGYVDSDTIIAVDGHKLLDVYPEIHVGAERWFFSQMMAVRAGATYTTTDQAMMWSAGLGFKFSYLAFDYAYGSHYDLSGNHVISVKLNF